MKRIFHITTKTEWEKAKSIGYYKAASLDTEGFIHSSKEEQVSNTLERHFKGQKDLILLVIDENLVSSFLKYEEAHGQMFPHLYKPIPLSAIVGTKDIPNGKNLRGVKLALLIIFFFAQSAYALPFQRWFDFDPEKVIVEDPNVTLLAELPSGDYN